MRLREYDYSGPGAYFVTLCTEGRKCLFGEILEGKVQLNDYGRVVEECWNWLANQYPYVEIDKWVVMPNHFHGLIVIRDDCRGGSRTALVSRCNRKSLGRLIGAFKTVSTKKINEIRDTPGVQVWQRNYYERVVRGEGELLRIRQYIQENPVKWQWDPENPDCVRAIRESPLLE